jgi:hypothetical protein
MDLSDDSVSALQPFRHALIGLPLSCLWRGYGSAIFLEFGRLTASYRRSGESTNPTDELGLMIQWS